MTTGALLSGVFSWGIVFCIVTASVSKLGKVSPPSLDSAVVTPGVIDPEVTFAVGAAVSNPNGMSRRFLLPHGRCGVVATVVVKFPCWLELRETVVEVLETSVITVVTVVDLTLAAVDGIDDVLVLVDCAELVPEGL